MLLGAVVVEHNPLAPAGELESEYARHGARVTIAWSKTLEKLTFLGRGHTTFSMDLTSALPTASRLALKLPVKAAREKREQLASPRPGWARSWTRAMRSATPWQGSCPCAMDDVALLIHTGGTTGVPKAAALTHANLMANVEESIAWVPVLHEGAEVFSSRRPKAQTSTCRRSTSPFRVRCLSRPRWPISGSTPRAVS